MVESAKMNRLMADRPQGESDTRAPTGLRSRKKARRREEILDHARSLFAEKGVDATTMAEIAEAAGVSTPTVFNYFGHKDGILIALITEGAEKARENSKMLAPRTDVDFLTTLMALFMDISVETMAIASKRIWRYANAAVIRHPETEFARSFEAVDAALLEIIGRILSQYALTLHDRSSADPGHVAHLFLDVWQATFQDFIRSDEMTIEAHEDQLHTRFAPLCRMIFAPDFVQAPKLA
jgi:AcrR family transcriptional regulator